MRIVKWQYKLLFAVAGYLLVATLVWLIPVHGAGAIIEADVFYVALVLAGARIFRGRSEDIRTPRAWWRMTSKRPLSKGLGILFSVISALNTVAAISNTILGRQSLTAAQFASAALYAFLAFLYVNSAVRLNRAHKSGLIRPSVPVD
jgi:quinol-cytochrome oxidoreductase complex cytochrome b subunit